MAIKVFLGHQINALSEIYEVSIITNLNGNSILFDDISEKVKIIDLPIKRQINIFSDFYVLILLVLLFRKNKFSLIHSVSPKAGLLSAISAWVSRTPNRFHTFTGQVWVHKKGISRLVLKYLDKIIIRLNTKILVDSTSQREFLIKEGLLTEENALVLGKGSLSGVDIKRFKPSEDTKEKIRKNLNIPHHSIVFLFLGRIKKDKGVIELVKAFQNVSQAYTNAYLLIVGPDEDNLVNELNQILGKTTKYTRFIDFTSSPENYMIASDVFVMPSYREGFGSVIIEAASCGIPAIGSNIYGLCDAIKDTKTGILVPLKSEIEIEHSMKKLLNDSLLRIQMGLNARTFAKENFSQEKITTLILQLYQNSISQ